MYCVALTIARDQRRNELQNLIESLEVELRQKFEREKAELSDLSQERDFYYSKLRSIEKVLIA
jgi:hypothetical protein